MPTGTPYYSFIPPYDIRVDDFTDSVGLTTVPALHLLTHTHSDHLAGLSAKSFSSTVVCSADAKEMLLKHEVYAERALHEMEVRAEKVRTFQHLRVAPKTMEDGRMNHIGSRDLLHEIALRTPKIFQLSNNRSVTITAFDANHCPGAVMYLVEGSQGAVLHTGDFRAEPWFLGNILREPLLQKYLAVPASRPDAQTGSSSTRISETLEAIYLDTACLLGNSGLPPKTRATSDLVALMCLYPATTYFFINSWTWGYEDVLKEVARAFQSKIHVDRYKYSVYRRLSDQFLQHIITEEASSTRFHACERFDRCEHVKVDGRASHTASGTHVVYINPVTMGAEKWSEYVADTKARLGRGEEVHNLLVPLSRHSSLPELRAFVSLFKPKRVVPNTLDPALAGLDCACLPAMFAGCVSPESDMLSECMKICAASPSYADWATLTQSLDRGKDVALLNLEGNGAEDLVQRWLDSGRPRRKLELLRPYLPQPQEEFVGLVLAGDRDSAGSLQSEIQAQAQAHSQASESSDSVLVTGEQQAQGRATLSQTKRAMATISAPRVVPSGFFSDEESVDEEEAHLQTAELLFLSPGSYPVEDPSSSPFRHLNNNSQHLLSSPKAGPSQEIPIPLQSSAIPPTPRPSECPDLRIPASMEEDRVSPILIPSAFPGRGEVLQMPLTPSRRKAALPSPKTSSQRPGKITNVSIWREEVASVQSIDPKKARNESVSRGFPLAELRGLANAPSLHNLQDPDHISSPLRSQASVAKRPRGGMEQCDGRNDASVCADGLEEMPLKRPRVESPSDDHQADRPVVPVSDVSRGGLSANAGPSRRTLEEDIDEAELERRRRVRLEALLAAEKFHRDRPEEAALDPEWTARTRRKAARARRKLVYANADKLEDSDRQCGDPAEILVDDGMQIDMERMEQLKASFQADFARGLRPGLVIPRLRASTAPPENYTGHG